MGDNVSWAVRADWFLGRYADRSRTRVGHGSAVRRGNRNLWRCDVVTAYATSFGRVCESVWVQFSLGIRVRSAGQLADMLRCVGMYTSAVVLHVRSICMSTAVSRKILQCIILLHTFLYYYGVD